MLGAVLPFSFGINKKKIKKKKHNQISKKCEQNSRKTNLKNVWTKFRSEFCSHSNYCSSWLQLILVILPGITIKYTCKCNSDIVGSGDHVICAFCRQSLHNWDPEDIPMIEHKKFSPECPFLNGTYYKSFIYWFRLRKISNNKIGSLQNHLHFSFSRFLI